MTADVYDTSTLDFLSYETLDGAPLKVPQILLDFDSLPLARRIDPALAIRTELDGWGVPGQGSTYIGPWRACTPGQPINVEAQVSCERGSLYVETSSDGTTVVDSVCPGNVNTRTLTGVTFTTTLSFYRLILAPSSRGLLLLRSQPRTA